ncbi:MAG TPA: toxin-antitoxin system HicB family antitoxin [Actinomycetota bacterium]|nr:toxin-antitoxin system HicB family antitoxin [Actinomycetota bacterium]
MDLRPYVENLHRQLAVAAEAGGEDARALAERLVAPLDSAVRLTLQDVLAAAAEEITVELAPGSVELRLRGREPEFVVTAPATVLGGSTEAAAPTADQAPGPRSTAGLPPPAFDGDEGSISRINLRMPDQLKAQAEQAAAAEGLSVNAWLVRAVSAAVGPLAKAREPENRPARGGHRFSGWAR